MEIKTEAYGTIDKIVKKQGNGAMILVPKTWLGKSVRVLLLEKKIGGGNIMNINTKKLHDAFIENAIIEMREMSTRASEYAKELENTKIDVEQDALVENFSREFNHTFSEIEIKK